MATLLVVYYSHSITTDGHQYIGGGLWSGQDASLIDLSGPSGPGRDGLEGCRYIVRIVCLS